MQSETPGARIALFRMDATAIGGQVHYFTDQALEGGEPPKFGGVTYTPIDVTFEDFETSGDGSLPRPRLRISNTNDVIQGLVNAVGDLCGSEIRRIVTFTRFLDTGSEPNPNAFLGPDVFVIERKSSENPLYIEWELTARIDQEGKMLPGRQIVRDACMWRYRRWDPVTLAFDYSRATCPYVSDRYFNELDQQTLNPSEDRCARRVSSCRVRFENSPKPFGGFPGTSRVRL